MIKLHIQHTVILQPIIHKQYCNLSKISYILHNSYYLFPFRLPKLTVVMNNFTNQVSPIQHFCATPSHTCPSCVSYNNHEPIRPQPITSISFQPIQAVNYLIIGPVLGKNKQETVQQSSRRIGSKPIPSMNPDIHDSEGSNGWEPQAQHRRTLLQDTQPLGKQRNVSKNVSHLPYTDLVLQCND